MNIMKRLRLNSFEEFLENTMSGAGSPGSGAPFFGNMGPAYGRPKFPSTGLNLTTITYDGKIYMLEDYKQLLNGFLNTNQYSDYIKNGGRPLDDFNLKNIQIIIELIKKTS